MVFVIFGFFVGVSAHCILDGLHLSLDWLHLIYNFVRIASIGIVLSPWAISGVMGALLYGTTYSAFSLLTKRRKVFIGHRMGRSE